MKISAPKFAAGPLAVLSALAMLAALPAVSLAQNIGVINVQKVFSDLREVKDIKSTFETKAQNLEQQKSAAQAQVNALVEQRKLFTPGSPEYANVNNEIVKAGTQAQVQIQIAQQELLNQQKTLTKQVFDKIDAAVAALAKERQLSMVVSQLNPEITSEMFERATPDQLNQALFSRSILFTADNVNLTSEVVTRMDAAYAASGPASSGGAPANPTPAPTTPTPAPGGTPAPRR